MNVSRETDRLRHLYTPTPDGFERRLRAWVSLPTDGGTAPDTGGANIPRKRLASTQWERSRT
jgi:hypothetical protein